MKKIGSQTAILLKQINNPNAPEKLYAKVTKRIPFNAWEVRKKHKSQQDLIATATSTINRTQVTLRTFQTKKISEIEADDTVIWKGQSYTVVDTETAENTLSLYGLDTIIYLER